MRLTVHVLAAALAASTLAACSSGGDSALDSADSASETGDSAGTGPGTLAISVKMDDDMVTNLEEDGESAAGLFSASIYAEADVDDGAGPIEGAVSLGEISATIDLAPDGGPSPVIYTSEPIEPQIVYVLGCLDSDASGGECEKGDPVTIPVTNKVIVEAGVETPFTVVLGIRNPS